jgi:hypothetical protein
MRYTHTGYNRLLIGEVSNIIFDQVEESKIIG